MTRLPLLLSLILLLLGGPVYAKGSLVADLDQKQVSITTDFNGAELLLFGALKLEDSDDIAIVVSGPPKSLAIRRKDKVAGIWINTENAKLVGIPSFYHILSTRPIEDIAPAEERARVRLGYTHIPFDLASGSRIEEGEIADWKEALYRNMEASQLWGKEAGDVAVMEDVLFRTNVVLPANVIPGQYDVRIMHFRDGRMINEDVSKIEVAKRGLSAQIFAMAHDYAAFYGIFAIIFAVASGWLAAAAFRR